MGIPFSVAESSRARGASSPALDSIDMASRHQVRIAKISEMPISSASQLRIPHSQCRILLCGKPPVIPAQVTETLVQRGGARFCTLRPTLCYTGFLRSSDPSLPPPLPGSHRLQLQSVKGVALK